MVLGAITTLMGSCSGSVGALPEESAVDQGDLLISYTEPEDSDYDEVYQILQDNEFYSDLIANLNATFAFPQDISIVFSSCGEENAWYDPELVEITMCYDLIKHYADIAQEEYQEDYAAEVIYASLFTFYHELGHALVDQYQLPITGKEEDAVDEFATILLLETEDYDAVIAGVEQFDIDAVEEAESEQEYPFWDEHSVSDQRFYDTACLIYGSDPVEFEDWADDDFLPPERAELCEEEFQQAQTSWDRLLTPYRL